jgi:hypothetical protein
MTTLHRLRIAPKSPDYGRFFGFFKIFTKQNFSGVPRLGRTYHQRQWPAGNYWQGIDTRGGHPVCSSFLQPACPRPDSFVQGRPNQRPASLRCNRLWNRRLRERMPILGCHCHTDAWSCCPKPKGRRSDPGFGQSQPTPLQRNETLWPRRPSPAGKLGPPRLSNVSHTFARLPESRILTKPTWIAF